MQADGILTATQAALLRESLNPHATTDCAAAIGRRRHGHKRLVYWAIGLLGAAIVIGFFMLMTGSGGTPPTPQDVASTLNDPGGIGQMNKSFSSVLAIALFLIVPLLLWMWLHNSLVTKEESVFESWAQVESNLERRADLIPALVDTVSRYLRHESETLEAVTAQRSNANLAAALEELLAAQKATADVVGGGNNIVEDESDLALLFTAQQRVGKLSRAALLGSVPRTAGTTRRHGKPDQRGANAVQRIGRSLQFRDPQAPCEPRCQCRRFPAQSIFPGRCRVAR
jgi:LemA protein